ncbi:DUF7344 domain-containing protein [Halomicrobium zhouii]
MASQSCYPDKAPQVSRLLDVLGHNLRREIIHFFENYTESQTVFVDELVSHLLGRIPETSADKLQMKLVHTHLPKLARTGWIDHDRRTDEVRYYGHDHAETWLGDLRAVFSDRTHTT